MTRTPNAKVDLLPCPFCAGTPQTGANGGCADFYVWCPGCKAEIKEWGSHSIESAARKWNTRQNAACNPSTLAAKVDFGHLAAHVASGLGALKGYGYEDTAAEKGLQYVLAELMEAYEAAKEQPDDLDYLTPFNELNAASNTESVYSRQARIVREEVALLGGLLPHEQIAHARKRELYIAELESRLKRENSNASAPLTREQLAKFLDVMHDSVCDAEMKGLSIFDQIGAALMDLEKLCTISWKDET